MAKGERVGEVLSMDDVRSLADAKSLARGIDYFRDGAVSRIDERGNGVRAIVSGSSAYDVELQVGIDGNVVYSCDCPAGSSGAFCKHLVAVSLALLSSGGGGGTDLPSSKATVSKVQQTSPDELIAEYVMGLSDAAVRELLLEAAERDIALQDKLLLAARSATAVDLPSMKAAVLQATRVSRSLDWRESGAFGEGLFALADTLRSWLAGPAAAEVVKLAELGIAEAEKSLEQIDDSNGDVMPGIVKLAAVHLEACRQTSPDPIKLAERLYRFQVDGAWDTFYEVIPAYVDPLGEKGLRCYRELVEHAWQQLPALSSEDGLRRSFDGKRTRLENAKIRLAELDGDLDELIAIRRKDLSAPYRYLLIAELCAENERYEDGLAWAQQGLAAFRNSDRRLLDFCVQEYLRRGDFGEANRFAWLRFEQRPDAETFVALMAVAQKTNSIDATRERGLAHLWQLVGKEEAAAGKTKVASYPRSRTTIVEIYLAAKNHDKAWEVSAGGPVSSNLWSTLAANRAKTHPDDAVALYHRLLAVAAEEGTRRARYDDAFKIVRKIQSLRTEQGEQAKFVEELDGIRKAYGAKRNFIKLLARMG